jgi:hypothetical protein
LGHGLCGYGVCGRGLVGIRCVDECVRVCALGMEACGHGGVWVVPNARVGMGVRVHHQGGSLLSEADPRPPHPLCTRRSLAEGGDTKAMLTLGEHHLYGNVGADCYGVAVDAWAWRRPQ